MILRSKLGTFLQFPDEPWSKNEVEPQAVFSGMRVVVDDEVCDREPFVSEHAAHYPDLGCRIEVRENDQLNPWHRSCRRRHYDSDVLVNFHGQTISFGYRPISHELHFLVNLTGEPTGIRLMLPARTCLVENDGLAELRMLSNAKPICTCSGEVIIGSLTRSFCGQEMGIELPEATPTFKVGLLSGDSPEPIEITKPDDWPLTRAIGWTRMTRIR